MAGDYLACVAEALAQGHIAQEEADTASDAYRGAYERASQTAGPDGGDRAGARAAQDALERKALETERRQVLQARRRAAILTGIKGLKDRRGYTDLDDPLGGGAGGGNGRDGWMQGGKPPESGPFKKGAVSAQALPLLMRNRPGLSGGPFPSVEGRYLAVRGLFDAKMAAVIEKFETHFGFDTPHRATLGNVVREAFGEDTGDAVSKHLAQAWGEAAELARQMFNEAGGDIPKLERWGLPQAHDAGKVYGAGKEAWVEAITPMLDRSRMLDRATNAPFTEATLRAQLEKTWESISSGGLVNAHPDQRLGMGSLATQRADERFLQFKSAADWQTYQGQFGRSDPFDAMMAHLDGMAKHIGAMQVLGPNPSAQFDWLKRMAEIEAAQEKVRFGNADADTKARGHIAQADAMWDTYTGKAGVPVNEKLAGTLQGIRQYLIGAELGSAILTDMPSALYFGPIARTFAGVSKAGDFAQLFKLLADKDMRAIARRMDFINDTARDGLVSTTQDQLRLLSVGQKGADGMNALARRLPPTTLRMSGLSGLFEQRKRSFRLSFMGALADAAGKSLDQLRTGSGEERMLHTELAARGFSESDWGKISAAEPWQPRPDVRILRPSDIAKTAGQDLALRVGEMVLNMEQLAVPVSGSLRTRAALGSLGRPGTVVGEAIRSVSLYKTFLLNVHDLFGQEMALRAMQASPDWMDKGVAGKIGRTRWYAGTLIALTLSGALTVQLKSIAAGKDPFDMGDWKFWAAGMLTGGSLGLLGDFLHSDTSPTTEHNALLAAAGPVGDLGQDVVDVAKQGVAEGVQDLGLGDPDKSAKVHAHTAREGLTLLHKYQPLGSLWWSKAAFLHGVTEQVQKAVDPDAQDAFDRSARRLKAQTGQDSWWQSGEVLPSRAPDLSAAWGTHQR